jgi:hypothetical protein
MKRPLLTAPFGTAHAKGYADRTIIHVKAGERAIVNGQLRHGNGASVAERRS